ncbi:MAG: hypothetical protein ACYDDF_14465 [Thermoplasmatota archaeon]
MGKSGIFVVAALFAVAIIAYAPLTDASTTPAPAPGIHLMGLLHSSQAAKSAHHGGGAGLNYYGGNIEKYPMVYIVFWGWGGSDPSGEAPYLQNFFNGVGGSSWINSQTQYYESVRGTITNPPGQLKGVWFDNSSTPPTSITQSQMATEALHAETHFGYNLDADYIVATPSGHSTSGFGTKFCAWHSSTKDSSGRLIAYTNLPYMTDAGTSCGENFVNAGTAGLLDGVSIVSGHEYAEAMTDPHPNTGWLTSRGSETGDLCAWSSQSGDIALSTGSFAVQPLYSDASGGCVMSG